MDPDLASKVIILAAMAVLIVVAAWQANKLEDIRYEEEKRSAKWKRPREANGKFKKKS